MVVHRGRKRVSAVIQILNKFGVKKIICKIAYVDLTGIFYKNSGTLCCQKRVLIILFHRNNMAHAEGVPRDFLIF